MEILMTILRVLLIGIGCGLLGIPLEAGKEDLPTNALLGATCFAAYLYVLNLSGNQLLATFIGSLVLSFLATYLTRKTRKPLQVYLVTAMIPLLPGYNIFKMVLSLINENYSDALYNANLTIQILSVIAISVVFASSVTKILRRYFKPKPRKDKSL